MEKKIKKQDKAENNIKTQSGGNRSQYLFVLSLSLLFSLSVSVIYIAHNAMSTGYNMNIIIKDWIKLQLYK